MLRIASCLLAIKLVCAYWVCVGPATACQQQVSDDLFGIQVVDEETGRGVPLVKLTTTGHIELWTDSQGWCCFDEPGLMNQEVYVHVHSPGYELQADGFGYRGVRLRTIPGTTTQISLRRVQPAERLYRVTGQGIFADSERLRLAVPPGVPALNAGVIGSDSVQMVPYRGELFWLWGDTNLPNYPLGNFHVTAATSPLPSGVDPDTWDPDTWDPNTWDPDAWDPSTGVPLQYFVDSETQRVSKMLPMQEPGAVWLFGLTNLVDPDGSEQLCAHYSRHLRLGEMVEHGIAVWNAERTQFEIDTTFDLENSWQYPQGQAVRHIDADGDFVYFANPFATVRVPARLDAFRDPSQYQAWAWDAGKGCYVWQSELPPMTQAKERELIAAGSLPPAAACFQMADRTTKRPIAMHRGSVNYNPFRKCWIMIAGEHAPAGQPSFLGEIWYAEAPQITGPWENAVKIATHPETSFYNPRHHACLDQRDGQVIFFEGTFTQMFSGNSQKVPRYEYNQIMYRLDLGKFPWD
jgi:hypothetical protein